jgi:hypothetical protein
MLQIIGQIIFVMMARSKIIGQMILLWGWQVQRSLTNAINLFYSSDEKIKDHFLVRMTGSDK